MVSMWINDDQSNSYMVGRVVDGSNGSQTSISSVTFTGSTAVNLNFGVRVNIGMNSYTKMVREGDFIGYGHDTGMTTAPHRFHGTFMYNNTAAVTKISFGSYTPSAPVGQQFLQGPMRLIIRAWNDQ